MRHNRIHRLVAAATVVIAVSGSAAVHADDDTTTTVAPTTTVETPTEAAKPTVSITVADVPVPTETGPTGDVAQPVVLDDPKPATTDGSTTTTSAAEPSTTIAAATAVAASTTLNPVQITANQEAIVTGTQVANGNTGGNLEHNDPGTPGSVPANSIATGAAGAVGSDDTNSVAQAADVVLTDQAIANVLQVALILNVGAALANSGANGVTATGAGSGANGQIGTGSATAVGNDMAQYITQAARVEGDANTDDAAKQLAVSLWMGIGLANSGTNAITGGGTAGSGGEVGSGDASATGNKSLTDVLQQAGVNGSGTSTTNIEQYATIMNMGFALANSGVNDVSGVAGGLLRAGDSDEQNQMALDLFSMLLPALMSSYAVAPGSGSIATGNATAVGNDSQTYVKQLALAANSGDGIASIIQDVLVANMGAAGANTGGNSLGGRYANLDPSAAKAVVTLAAFLSQMLAFVHTQSSDKAQALQQQGLEVPFGDIVLTIQGALQSVDTSLTNESGARANVRQVTIVLSLGIAQANSGLNTAVNQNNAFNASVNDPTQRIDTGDAVGVNQGLVIICQRRNADDIKCLVPPPNPDPIPPIVDNPDAPATFIPEATSPVQQPNGLVINGPAVVDAPVAVPVVVVPAVRVTPVPTRGGQLPATGIGVDDTLILATLLAVIGSALVLARRRRRVPPQARPQANLSLGELPHPE